MAIDPVYTAKATATGGRDGAGVARLNVMLADAGLAPELVNRCIADSGGVGADDVHANL